MRLAIRLDDGYQCLRVFAAEVTLVGAMGAARSMPSKHTNEMMVGAGSAAAAKDGRPRVRMVLQLVGRTTKQTRTTPMLWARGCAPAMVLARWHELGKWWWVVDGGWMVGGYGKETCLLNTTNLQEQETAEEDANLGAVRVGEVRRPCLEIPLEEGHHPAESSRDERAGVVRPVFPRQVLLRGVQELFVAVFAVHVEVQGKGRSEKRLGEGVHVDNRPHVCQDLGLGFGAAAGLRDESDRGRGKQRRHGLGRRRIRDLGAEGDCTEQALVGLGRRRWVCAVHMSGAAWD